MENQATRGGVLGASANFPPSGMLMIRPTAFYLRRSGWTFFDIFTCLFFFITSASLV